MTTKVITGFFFGRECFAELGETPQPWRFADTGEPIKNAPQALCPKCLQPPTKEGHDPCIANMPGVLAACCGHGVTEGYVFFESGHVIRGYFDE